MPAIALPPISSEAVVKLPAAPSDPPTDTDIANVKYFSSLLVPAWQRSNITDTDLARGVLFEKEVEEARMKADRNDRDGDDPDVPVWFEGAMRRALVEAFVPVQRQMNTIQGQMNTMQGQMNTMQGQMNTMQVEVGKTRRMGAILMNQSAGNGDDVVYEIVPFRNGQDPTLPPHNLPPLTSRVAINTLSPHERDDYYKGYYGTNRGTLAAVRIPGIFTAIGSKAP